MENTPIINRPNILFPHFAILRPQHKIRRHPLKHRSTPANRIRDIPLPLDLLHQRPNRQIILPVRILCEDVLELLRPEPALRVVRVRVGAVLCAVDVGQVDAEEGVGEPGGRGGVREVDVDYEERKGREQDPEAEVVEPDKGVAGPEDAVAVAVEEFAVLLEHGLVAVLLSPVAVGGAVGFVVGGGDVGARETWGLLAIEDEKARFYVPGSLSGEFLGATHGRWRRVMGTWLTVRTSLAVKS